MKKILLLTMMNMAAFFFLGCGPSPESEVKKMFRPSQDKDVTASPEYNFSPFTNTIWKTKVKTAIADLKRYTSARQITLLPPDSFDPTDPRYTRIPDMRLIAVLPPGTHLRIARLMQDQGAWGGVQVEAIIEDGTNAQKTVYLETYLLAGNRWYRGPYSNTNWAGNPDMLEKAEAP